VSPKFPGKNPSNNSNTSYYYLGAWEQSYHIKSYRTALLGGAHCVAMLSFNFPV